MSKINPRAFRVDWSWLALAPAALLLGGFLLLPAALGFGATFTNYSPPGSSWHGVGLANYRAVLTDPGVRVAFTQVGWLTLLVVPLAVGGGLLLAIALRRPFRGRSLVRALLLLPWLVSPIAAGVMWHFLYNTQVGFLAGLGLGGGASPLGDRGLALPAVALVEVWRLLPLAAFLLLPGILTLPQDELDQATLAGSPPWRTLVAVVLPRLRGLLLTVLLLLVGQVLTAFDEILILTGGGPGDHTVTPAFYSYQSAVQTHNWPVGTTIAWLLVGVVLLLGGVYLRVLRREAEW